MSDAQTQEAPQVIQDLKGKFDAEIVRWDNAHGQLAVTLRKDRIIDVLRYLKETGGYNHLADVTCVDFLREPKEAERFVVVYTLYSFEHNVRLRLRALVSDSDATIDSACELWKGANWSEREVYDLFGITFNNHPDLRRLLMPDDYQGHPLRKDYPLKGRGERESFTILRDEPR
jgi:NADH-quinone oxidoreductase subunit C